MEQALRWILAEQAANASPPAPPVACAPGTAVPLALATEAAGLQPPDVHLR